MELPIDKPFLIALMVFGLMGCEQSVEVDTSTTPAHTSQSKTGTKGSVKDIPGSGRKKDVSMDSEKFEEGVLERLTSKEIERLVTGTSIVVAPASVQQVVPFGERFSANGDWFGNYQGRGPVSISGQWTVKRDALCVEVIGRSELCRPIWSSGAEGDHLIVPYFESERGNREPVSVKFVSQD